ncbi:reverse transcriptase [Teladorsagia circumcincta]|uniref:RNA-directed DNA polymerase n=1 Tax=Teladorsagia circumcincta TaxID=45464 RepID=A0A2G9TV94_TELCI|nr:reverse transcriptase [Teladorsagia circumcincta]
MRAWSMQEKKGKVISEEGAVPVLKKKRPVPYASIPELDAEIDRLVSNGVISPVDHSEWAAPIVAVKKKNGQIRLCADFSTGLNDALQLHQHPLPTAEEVFTRVNGGQIFSQIDLADAYLYMQVEVEEKSKEMLTINTHKGLYRYNRLPFGVKSAPGIFQQIMDSMICGLQGVAAYLDDIIVTGRTYEEHRQNLEALLDRIAEYGFHVRLEKCNFLMPRIRYLGFIIDKDGRRPDPEKIEAIRQMPVPRNIAEVRSFLGMISYYGSFVAEMRKIRAPLDDLLKNAVFRWTSKCEEAFQHAKDVLTSDLLLTHFDPSLEIIVAADASDYGIGAVILHRMPNGTEKAICHASRSLTAAERNYGQIEKEGLALIFAVRKFHRYIYGRRFKLLTDHKPLLHIFGSMKAIPTYTANRLQRWKLILMGYNFNLEYRSTTEFGQADALSRLIPSVPNQTEDIVIAKIEQDILAVYEASINALPVTRTSIQEESRKDSEISKITEMLKQGSWPAKPEGNMRDWKALRHALSTQDGCLYFGHRIVIPKSLRGIVLKQLHKGHRGMTRMKMLARGYVHWMNINRDIEENVRHCSYCQETAKMPGKLFSIRGLMRRNLGIEFTSTMPDPSMERCILWLSIHTRSGRKFPRCRRLQQKQL